MGKIKNIEIDILNFKEEEVFQESDFFKRQKLKREYYTKIFDNNELEEKGSVQLKLIF